MTSSVPPRLGVTAWTTWESLREMCSCADVMGPTDAMTPLAEITANKVEKLIVVVRAARQSCQPVIAFLPIVGLYISYGIVSLRHTSAGHGPYTCL